ncbi:MAG: tRNA dimethylallyltransferase [Selenomonadaceae bacterium]|nr:tRNA dimethylallyltransferase [Selenomonadaceae bacterium]
MLKGLTKIFPSIQLLRSAASPKEKLIVILGATATGKSSLALRIADELGSEIISADSMLVYKNFDIGTAKPSKEELRRVKHHFVDILEPDEIFSVADFQTQAARIISDLNRADKIPIVVGGTGLYIQALIEGYEFNDVGDDGRIEKSFVSRYKRTGELVYDATVIGLELERQELYRRINERTRAMFANGLVDEVKHLIESGVDRHAQAMLGIGYKETIEYLDGRQTLEETIETISRATRHYAKRQATWFRRMKYIDWHRAADD